MSGGRKSGPGIPEHQRRERGQVRFCWRTSEALLDELAEHARERGESTGEALTRIVLFELGIDSAAERLHHLTTGQKGTRAMAKGSGGVGKKSGSVSGSVAKAAPAPVAKAAGIDLAAAPLGEFASAVAAAADKVKINSMAPIAQVHAELKTDMPLADFKRKLIKAFQDDKIDLARNDLGVDRFSSDLLRRSEADMSGRVFVFIRRSDF